MTEFPQSFPATRMRRLRQAPWVRSLTAETVLTPADLVWAVFVHDGEGRVPVASLPGVDRLSVKEAALAAKRAKALGIPAIALFPYIGPESKDAGLRWSPLRCAAWPSVRPRPPRKSRP